ncbi:iron complex transport system substrate-binding protein [Pullulanibacillus pueri]|uniref:Iron siderophore-binding protein n=1 Tax=Pullulanibacillus pueri TaxID=1437324 RepID=A0A8J2ZTX4_9BACL|nr:iron-siderophore ABC transporter substrate-binding protein [Pullulanibacillus pueri]MBM7681875.1 iron complex transport system substrate-binding protein [Pullulanibacillus pueri]GGH76432.1 iron siderophore-binding protein [Pullulanibacillus pueri]
MMKKRYLILSAIIVLLLVLSGCGASNKASSASGDTSSNEKGSASSYTVKHAMGTTTIKGTPKRVVVLTNEGTEALLSMGVKPVGAVQSWTGDPWYDHIKDQMDGVKVVGTESEINLEAIASLHPDLIIGNKMRQEKQYDKLKAIAPTVFSDELRGDWQINFKLYAKALNKEEKGKEVLDAFNDKVKNLHDKLGDKINAKISLVRFMAGDTRIYHKDTFAGVILDEIGLKRPASQDKDDFAAQNVSKEMIPDMDGDYLFYFTYEPSGDNGQAAKLENQFTNNKIWKNLNAVKSGHVYKVDDAIWNTAGGVIAANKMVDELSQYLTSDK